MKSRWYELKPAALQMRKEGSSLREVARELGISKSTLSGWFKNVKLNSRAQYKLTKNRLKSLQKARMQAIIWHNQQRERRQKEAENKAMEMLSRLEIDSQLTQNLALAMLYLGEGGKTKNGTVMGSSDPLILKFFINSLIKNHDVNIKKIKCSLHLRADQDPEILKKYWSKELDIPLENFTSPSIDLRSTGYPTYPQYNGVCVVNCGNIALQRKLIYLSRKFCEKVIENRGS